MKINSKTNITHHTSKQFINQKQQNTKPDQKSTAHTHKKKTKNIHDAASRCRGETFGCGGIGGSEATAVVSTLPVFVSTTLASTAGHGVFQQEGRWFDPRRHATKKKEILHAQEYEKSRI